MNTAPLGLGDTALPWAVTAEVGRPGGRGPWSLALPKTQDRQIPPTSTRRSVRKPRMAQSPEWRGQGGWARGGPGRGQGGPGPAGVGKVARCSPGPLSVRSASASPASCRKPRLRPRWCWTAWRSGRSDGREGPSLDSAPPAPPLLSNRVQLAYQDRMAPGDGPHEAQRVGMGGWSLRLVVPPTVTCGL